MFKGMFGCRPVCPPEDAVIGYDCEGNEVYRCEKTNLLYIYGEAPKKYISVTKVIFDEEEGYEEASSKKKKRRSN